MIRILYIFLRLPYGFIYVNSMVSKLKKYLFLLLCLWNIQQRFRQISHLSWKAK